MKFLTLGEAEREVGVTKSTISRAIKDGRLSANRNEHGHFQIDPAELFRVYEPINRNGTTETEYDTGHSSERNPQRNTTQQSVQHHATPQNDTDEHDMVPWLRERLEKVEEKLTETEEELEKKEMAYNELREAYNTLPSPDDFDAKLAAEVGRLEQEKAAALIHSKKRHEDVLNSERAQNLKIIAEQKELHAKKNEAWRAALHERKNEIRKARAEAEAVKSREQRQSEELRRERQRLAALESRGLIARLLNRKPNEMVG